MKYCIIPNSNLPIEIHTNDLMILGLTKEAIDCNSEGGLLALKDDIKILFCGHEKNMTEKEADIILLAQRIREARQGMDELADRVERSGYFDLLERSMAVKQKIISKENEIRQMMEFLEGGK